MKILIVEKNPQIADGLRRELQTRGHAAARMTTQELRANAETRGAVVLLDWDLEASELLGWLRDTGRMVPVLAGHSQCSK